MCRIVGVMPAQPLNSAEVALILGKTVRTVQRMARQGKLPYSKKFGGDTGAYLFDPADVLAYQLRQHDPPASQQDRMTA